MKPEHGKTWKTRKKEPRRRNRVKDEDFTGTGKTGTNTVQDRFL